MNRKRLASIIAAILVCGTLLLPFIPVEADGSVMQAQNCHTSSAVTSYGCALTNPTTYGNVLVVGFEGAIGTGSDTVTVADSQGNVWICYPEVATLLLGSAGWCVATVVNAGSDTITLTQSETAYVDFTMWEIYGVTGVGTTAQGTGTSATAGTTSTTLPTGSIALAELGYLTGSSIMAGSGFTLLPSGNPTVISYEYGTAASVGSPTTFPFTWTGSVSWYEYALVLYTGGISTTTITDTTTITSTTSIITTVTIAAFGGVLIGAIVVGFMLLAVVVATRRRR